MADRPHPDGDWDPYRGEPYVSPMLAMRYLNPPQPDPEMLEAAFASMTDDAKVQAGVAYALSRYGYS